MTTDQGVPTAAGNGSPRPGTRVSLRRPATTSALQGPPSPPRRRRPALTALAVLLIVGGAALAGLLAVRVDSREPVLVLNRDVPVGTRLTSDMFSQTGVASDGLSLVPVDQVSQVEGLYVRQDLYEGQLLDERMLTTKPPISSRYAQVGVPLDSGAFPPGVTTGDQLELLRISDSNDQPSQALCTGLVLGISSGSKGGFGSTASTPVATVLVPRTSAEAVVGAAGADALGGALQATHVSLGKADIVDLSGVG